MKHGILLLALLVQLATTANDGVYWGSGGVLHPIKETRISMAREFLSFTCRDGYADVQVLFDFFNPDSVPRSLLIGFQAPSASGDLPDSLCSIPPIKNLRIMKDGALLPYRMNVAECGDCPLAEPGSMTFSQSEPGVFVYLFDITFQPGMNRVQHSYTFRSGGGVDRAHSYNYILTTGAKWAGGRIGQFSLEVDMGRNAVFHVPDIFGPSATWSIVGTGRIGKRDDVGRNMVRTISGKLLISVDDLAPEEDLEFYTEYVMLDWPGEDGPYNMRMYRALWERSVDDLGDGPLNKQELRWLRNTIYAQYGHVFKDPELKRFFEQFEWYIPDPNVRADAIPLSPEDKLFIELIKLKEME